MSMETKQQLRLICATCGSDAHFKFNEDKSYIKCMNCNKEYRGGYNELLELNKDRIKQQIAQEVKSEILNKMKEAFKNNKNIKIK